MSEQLNDIRSYFREKVVEYGEQAQGVDWNSPYAQETRFDQLLKVIVPEKPFTILDYGCGYGAMAEYMREKGLNFEHYYGYDIVPESLEKCRSHFSNDTALSFYDNIKDIPPVNYVIASGVFNIKLDHDYDAWTEHVLRTMDLFDSLADRGFSSNFLTSYSDKDRMDERPDLYFADPCVLFDYCRRNFAHNVALLHDYKIWDFSIIVRKEFD